MDLTIDDGDASGDPHQGAGVTDVLKGVPPHFGVLELEAESTGPRVVALRVELFAQRVDEIRVDGRA